MPIPIPNERLLAVSLKYLSCRQKEQRPTTKRQLATRMGVGADHLLGLFEHEKVQYVLIPHSERKHKNNVEILLKEVPQPLAGELQIDNEMLKNTFALLFKEPIKPMSPVEYLKVTDNTLGHTISAEEAVDPFFNRHLSTEQFEAMKENLVIWDELVRIAIEKGYAFKSIYRSVGGPRMRYALPSEYWRPYIYRGKRYFDKEILNRLPESDRSYKWLSTAKRKRLQRMIAQGEVREYSIFSHQEGLWNEPDFKKAERKKKDPLPMESYTVLPRYKG